jgi:O-antigen ligase
MTTHLNPLVNSENGVPFNAHNDYVRFFFEGGIGGLAFYLCYQALLVRWVIRHARSSSPAQAATGRGLAAALLGMTFLTGGTTELSLHTADLYLLYGMLALVGVSGAREAIGERRDTVSPVRPDPRGGGSSGEQQPRSSQEDTH